MDRRRRRFLLASAGALGLLAGCAGDDDSPSPTDASTDEPTDSPPPTTALASTTDAATSDATTGAATSTPAVDAEITRFLRDAVADDVFPGAAVGVLDADGTVYRGAVGNAQEVPEERELTLDTVFDLASASKAVATTTAVVQLVERGDLSLETTLADVYDDVPDAKRGITVHNLVTHTSGLPAWQALWEQVDEPSDAIGHILRDVSLAAEPGAREHYSDLGFILLGDVVEQVSGTSLDEYTAANVFDPLGMDDTAYNPGEILDGKHSYAATEDSAYHGGVVVGEVHDENAAFLGGVAGHAGLFSTVDDLSTFARTLLNGGAVDGTRILSEESVQRMTKNQLPDLGGGRGLGWERRHVFGYTGDGYFDEDTFGQNGFTGTSLWVAPNREVAVVTLTNRVHPSRENTKILDFRGRFHNFLARLLADE